MKFLILATLFVCAYAVIEDTRIYEAQFYHYTHKELPKYHDEIQEYMFDEIFSQNQAILEERFGVKIGGIMDQPIDENEKEKVENYLDVEFQFAKGHKLPSNVVITATYSPSELEGMSSAARIVYLRAVFEIIDEHIHNQLVEIAEPDADSS